MNALVAKVIGEAALSPTERQQLDAHNAQGRPATRSFRPQPPRQSRAQRVIGMKPQPQTQRRMAEDNGDDDMDPEMQAAAAKVQNAVNSAVQYLRRRWEQQGRQWTPEVEQEVRRQLTSGDPEINQRYRGLGESTVARIIGTQQCVAEDNEDPEMQAAMERVRNQVTAYLSLLRKRFEAQGRTWTPEVEKMMRQQLLSGDQRIRQYYRGLP